MAYGQEAIFPSHVLLPSLQLSLESSDNQSSALQERINTLILLQEEKEKAKNKFALHQNIIKKWFDKHKARNKYFEVGDVV